MLRLLVILLLVGLAPAHAQFGPAGPPAVGVAKAERTAITESNQFVGRIQATNRVDLVARVSAFLNEQLFTEGSEVRQGDLLYRLERGPFEADLQQKAAVVAQDQALVTNATITLGRAEALLNTPAGQRSTVDDARAQQLSQQAQLMQAQANFRASQINLAYTEIHAPIAGKIGRSLVTIGNVVGPSTGTLATIVSQDPMYVVFPISVRTAIDLRNRYASNGGFSAVLIRLQLPDGTAYPETGKLNFVDNTISQNTDTILLRGVIANPVRPGTNAGDPGSRELADGEFVTVLLQGVEPVQVLGIPRRAVLTDQQGDYVYVVDAQNKAEQRRIQLGQSTPTVAVVTNGLAAGETVIVDGVQRVHPGQAVSAGPASPGPNVAAETMQGAAPAAASSNAGSGAPASPSGGAAPVASGGPATPAVPPPAAPPAGGAAPAPGGNASGGPGAAASTPPGQGAAAGR
ncbi:MAG: efflux RND transporter periplasmic adaptor subunit [Acidisphaera sp.]|nr:efflux RND transporter periplasmic adaptor subunit [Acidisphaera sp.]